MCNFVGIVDEDVKLGERQKYNGPWMTECDAQEVVDLFADWEPQVKDLCKVCDSVCFDMVASCLL